MFTRLIPAPAEESAAVTWDDAPCPLCGHEDAATVLEAPDPTPASGTGLVFAVVRCQRCGMAFTNPRPDAESIGAFYPADYRPHRRPRKMSGARSLSWAARMTGRGCKERRGLLPWTGTGRLLDFGCGGGSYLKRMADQGWAVTGLDASVGAVRQIQEELGLAALVGSLPHPDLKPCSFEVVTMWHSLEHVHDPVSILREAFRLLVPGGKLVVACPNLAGWPFKWFGGNWFGLDLPRHLTHFTPATLSETLTVSGFRVESVRMIRHSDWLRSSAKLAVRSGPTSFWHRALTWKLLAKAAAAACHSAGMSDCMMAVAERPEQD
ncbi:MAG TPA: class I SAM-dependent methyltransferase [Fimbriiglobus sp.]|jgi:2-polyprenyl-3-methyl-5-hydroxy-6-metoxy-1,4-benzoquinol methylase